jgi:hypothetical protein
MTYGKTTPTRYLCTNKQQGQSDDNGGKKDGKTCKKQQGQPKDEGKKDGKTCNFEGYTRRQNKVMKKKPLKKYCPSCKSQQEFKAKECKHS